MGRMPRIEVEGAIYYVTPISLHSKPIFVKKNDYEFYYELLAKYKDLYKFKLYAFSLTPKDIDLLIEPCGTATISRIMHDLIPAYTKYFNKKYDRTGRLFNKRYRVVLIEKAPNLVKMTSYIHMRPKLLRLSGEMDRYKYSSFLPYLAEESIRQGAKASKVALYDKLNMTHEIADVLDSLKEQSYRQFVQEMAPGEIKALSKVLEKDKVIGSQDFRKKVELMLRRGKEAPEEASRSTPVEELSILDKPVVIERLCALPQPAPIEEPAMPPQAAPSEEPTVNTETAPIEKPYAEPQTAPPQIPTQAARSVSGIWTFVLALFLIIISVLGAIFYAHTNIIRMKESMDREIARKDTELQDRLSRELDATSKNLSNTYEAKLASYKATIESIEAQKKRADDELSKTSTSLRLRNGALRLKRSALQEN